MKVKDFKNSNYRKEDITSPVVVEEIQFYDYMIDKMKELGEYVGIDTTNFSDDFYVSDNSLNFPGTMGSKLQSKDVCCYNKVGNIFTLLIYKASIDDDIFLKKAITCQINLEDGTFVYHEFKRPMFLICEVSITHRKMSGVIPRYLFIPKRGYNIVTNVINADFDESTLSHNFIDELEEAIISGNNQKEYINDDSIMWEMRDTLESLYVKLRLTCKSLYQMIKDLPKEEAKKVLIEHSSEIDNPTYALELLDLIDYKIKCDERKISGNSRVHK